MTFSGIDSLFIIAKTIEESVNRMILNFDELQTTIIPNFYGGEKEVRAKMHVDKRNKIMLGRLAPGASIGLHTHETNSEILYVLEGEGKVLFDGDYEKVRGGLCHYCPKGHAHSLINDSEKDLVFFAVVPEQA